MLSCHIWPIGICSWSLKNEIPDLEQVMNESGITHLHLSLDPELNSGNSEYLKTIQKHQWQPTAAMIGFDQEDYSTLESIRETGGIVPDQYWEKNREKVLGAIELTSNLGIELLSFHFGFIDDSQHALRERVLYLADAAQRKNVLLLMETGQETAQSLSNFLEELSHPALGVNFDPANMVLYGKGNPVSALETLKPWVKHVHIKDARKSSVPDQWGEEVPWGEGDFINEEFLKTLNSIDYKGALAIEREAGTQRSADIQHAARLLSHFTA